MFIALQEGDIDLVIFLASKVDRQEPANDKATPIFIASQQGHIDIVNCQYIGQFPWWHILLENPQWNLLLENPISISRVSQTGTYFQKTLSYPLLGSWVGPWAGSWAGPRAVVVLANT